MTQKIVKTDYKNGIIEIYKHRNKNDLKLIETGEATKVTEFIVKKYTIYDYLEEFVKQYDEDDELYGNLENHKYILEFLQKSKKRYIWKLIETYDYCDSGLTIQDEYHLFKRDAIVRAEDETI